VNKIVIGIFVAFILSIAVRSYIETPKAAPARPFNLAANRLEAP
jgi:hypothetical protein